MSEKMPEPSSSSTALPTRRSLLGGALAAGAAAALGLRPSRGATLPAGEAAAAPGGAAPRVVVVGAGAFGGWTALWLARRGARVSLVDAWGPGNSRASSGGESRVIRGMYGRDEIYTRWVARAFEVWRDSDRQWGTDLYHPTGALWMFQGGDDYARSSLPVLAACGLGAEELALGEARRRYPQVDFAGVRAVYFEPEAGYLVARRACQAVGRAFVAAGGELRRGRVEPGALEGGRMRTVRLEDGSELGADLFVFACGPWLGQLFPEVVGEGISPTRQEVFYFGTPGGASPYDEGSLPIWIDFGEHVFYGIPGNEQRGFKVADDSHGARVDPTTLDRRTSAEALEQARQQLRRRFPGLAGAPVVESRVCQYENTPDGHYLLDRHPGASNVWLLGGGSGHGFKLGPALGEQAAGWVLGDGQPPSMFALARLAGAGRERSQLSTGGES